jgi:hypothetical protein
LGYFNGGKASFTLNLKTPALNLNTQLRLTFIVHAKVGMVLSHLDLAYTSD